jgi:hypothetical protein
VDFHAIRTIETKLDLIITEQAAIREDIRTMSQTLQTQIAALQADVTAEDTVIDGATVLIQGFSAQLAAAIATAQAAGATPAELQSLTDLGTTITTKTAALAAAVQANTPAAPTS